MVTYMQRTERTSYVFHQLVHGGAYRAVPGELADQREQVVGVRRLLVGDSVTHTDDDHRGLVHYRSEQN